jgi:hypothetical protein
MNHVTHQCPYVSTLRGFPSPHCSPYDKNNDRNVWFGVMAVSFDFTKSWMERHECVRMGCLFLICIIDRGGLLHFFHFRTL